VGGSPKAVLRIECKIENFPFWVFKVFKELGGLLKELMVQVVSFTGSFIFS
jgi:hypothetical protein